MYKIFTITLLTIIGCKDHPSFIEAIDYQVKDNFINLDIEFNNELELNTEFNIPVKDYGYVSISARDNDLGFILGLKLDLKIIEDQEIKKIQRTNLLPNGQRMSRYVKKKLYKIVVDDSSSLRTSFYLGPDKDHLYIGTALEIKSINERFPSNFSISTRIRDKQKRSLGSLAFFGANVKNEQLKTPGGFFFVSNVTDLISYIKENSSQGTKQKVNLKTLEVTKDGKRLGRSESRKIINKILKLLKQTPIL
jgi:hypothetical protein